MLSGPERFVTQPIKPMTKANIRQGQDRFAALRHVNSEFP